MPEWFNGLLIDSVLKMETLARWSIFDRVKSQGFESL